MKLYEELQGIHCVSSSLGELGSHHQCLDAGCPGPV